MAKMMEFYVASYAAGTSFSLLFMVLLGSIALLFI
jgi:hypothetical protein